jgi:hypothetical protein
MHQSRFSVLVILAIALAIPTAARSVTLQVANTGADGPSCGSVATPCRSIGNAVANAVPDDTILVGPGIYSADLDKDGVQSEPGEEPVILTIDKAVKVLVSISTHSTYSLLVALYSATLGLFIPSAGSKWVIEAPYVMQAAIANPAICHLDELGELDAAVHGVDPERIASAEARDLSPARSSRGQRRRSRRTSRRCRASC